MDGASPVIGAGSTRKYSAGGPSAANKGKTQAAHNPAMRIRFIGVLTVLEIVRVKFRASDMAGRRIIAPCLMPASRGGRREIHDKMLTALSFLLSSSAGLLAL